MWRGEKCAEKDFDDDGGMGIKERGGGRGLCESKLLRGEGGRGC